MVSKDKKSKQQVVETVKPHFVVSVVCVMPDGDSKQVMGFDESTGNLAYSPVVLREIVGAMANCFGILEQSLDPENNNEVIEDG